MSDSSSAADPPPVAPVRTRAEVEERIAALAPTLRALGVERVRLFGSFARGEQTAESDVDLLVDFPADLTLIGLLKLEHAAEDVLGRKVDVVSSRHLRPRFRQAALQDAHDVAVAA